jgi:cell wall-associated NlpC family hydrolase
VKDQFEEGREVDADDLRPGDLVFFRTDGRRVSHVGIAIGGDRFVHAPNSRGVVRVESLGSDYWSQHYVGARRIE